MLDPSDPSPEPCFAVTSGECMEVDVDGVASTGVGTNDDGQDLSTVGSSGLGKEGSLSRMAGFSKFVGNGGSAFLLSI